MGKVNKHSIVFKYWNNIEIMWDEEYSFTVSIDGKIVNSFQDLDIKNIDQAQRSADEWLEMELEEEKLRYADAY
tara:strand:+ start:485 stop:706 length:222 start_codon:yes stop_codon:yes gene_type:complete